MKPKDLRTTQHLPQRQYWSVFLYSIRSLPLHNSFVPEFDSHAETILNRLNPSEHSFASIGDALDAICPGCDNDDEKTFRFAIKQILFGYSLTNGWVFWARFEQDSEPAILLRSVFESCCLAFCSDFRTAKYGPLTLRMMAVDRMDQSEDIGQPDYHPRVLYRSRLLRTLLGQPKSTERDSKFETVQLMVNKGDLSNNVRSLSKEALRAAYDERIGACETRVLLIEDKPIHGTIEEIISENEIEKSGKGGRPNKDAVITEAFFTWLLEGKFRASLTKTSVIDWVLETNANLRAVGIEDKKVSPRKVDLYFKAQSFWVDERWMPENWEQPFQEWRMQKLT